MICFVGLTFSIHGAGSHCHRRAPTESARPPSCASWQGSKNPAAARCTAHGLRLGYLPQEATQISGSTLWEYCLQAFEPLLAQAEQLKAFGQAMQSHEADTKLVEQYGSVLSRFEQAGGYTYPTRIKQTLAGLGFEAGDYERPLAGSRAGSAHALCLPACFSKSPRC